MTALATGAVLALVLLEFAAGSLLVAMGDACRGIFAAGHGFLAASPINYFLAVAALTIVLLQGSFLTAGGLKMLKTSRGSRLARNLKGRFCPALGAITGGAYPGRIFLIDGSDNEVSARTVGLFRPGIYLSQGLVKALPGPELRAVIAHEKAHCSGRDNLVKAVARTMVLSLFYLPGPRMAYNRMRLCLEVAADRKAAGPARAGSILLAGTLAKIASFGSAGPRPDAVSAVSGHGDLAARITALIAPEREQRRCSWHRVTAFVIILTVIFAAFAMSAQAAAGSGQRDTLLCFTRHHIPEDGTCELEHSPAQP